MFDANAVVKWIVPKGFSERERALLETEHELLAPDIILVEAANALLKNVQTRELRAADAREAIEALPRYLRVPPAVEVYEHALEVSFEFGCTFFDALYVAFALEQDCPLITGEDAWCAASPDPWLTRSSSFAIWPERLNARKAAC